MDNSASIIGNNIRQIRDCLGLTQKGFSELGNISPATLVNIESGKKTFRIKSLDQIILITNISLQELANESFSPSKNLRTKLIKKYEKNLEISVILNRLPTLKYSIQQKILTSDFLSKPKEIIELTKFLQKLGLTYKGNSIHVALKRMPNLIKIEPHPIKQGTFVYSKK